MTAQNQHYVPKLALRYFLCDDENERVSVYDKHTDRTFVTSIKNVMAERRFNDFHFREWIVSFEQISNRLEEMILPRYRKIIETRRLEGTPQEKADLGLLIAFQFTRTRASREWWLDIDGALKAKVEALGRKMEDVQGWSPMTEDRLKMQHLSSLKRSVAEFAGIIAQKDFMLAESAPGTSFSLGDNPVCLHNEQDFGPYGNLGLAVPGIQIYLPLTPDLLLCAWCPSLLSQGRKNLDEIKKTVQRETLAALMAGKISGPQMKTIIKRMAQQYQPTEALHRAFAEGRPISSDLENLDFYNSLQSMFAYRYIISKDGNFDLARRHNREHPGLRKGKRPSFG